MFSFLTGISWQWCLIGGLLLSLSASLWYNKHQIEVIVGYKIAQESYVKALESSQKAIETKDLSCKIDDTSVSEVTAEKEEVRNKIDDLVVKITKLKTGVPITPNNTEVKNNAKITNVYGPELIDTSLRILLNQAYCVASPDNTGVCGTTR